MLKFIVALAFAVFVFSGSPSFAAQPAPAKKASVSSKKKPKKRDPRIRLVPRSQAWKPRPGLPQHINIKVTPPLPTDRPKMVHVEVYNRTKFDVATVLFDIAFQYDGYTEMTTEIEASNLLANGTGSAVRSAVVPKEAQITGIDAVVITNFNVISAAGHTRKVPYFIDIISD